tara:strand:- start:21 stop:389 length:369 start_codon:yes stop_codon:yes gene_type:complete
MKFIGAVSILCAVMLVGCIAGPTPHPSKTEDNGGGFTQDAGSRSNAPPRVGENDDCEASGGEWDGDECLDAAEPSMDVSSGSDSDSTGDASDDAGPSSDAETEVLGDLVEAEENWDATETEG